MRSLLYRRDGETVKGTQGSTAIIPSRGGGFALFSVLVILAVLTPVVVNLAYSTRVQMAGADYFACKARSREVARAGLESAMLALKKDDRNYDSYLDDWGRFGELSRFSGSLFDEGWFAGRIEDEEGKIKVNRLILAGAVDPRINGQLTRLFETLDIDTDILDALVDWLDEDGETELTGAEDDYYASLDDPYSAKDGAIDVIGELRLVRGVTDEIFLGKEGERGLVDYLSPFGEDLRVNVNTAPAEVLEALTDEVDRSLVEEITEYRRDEPFTTVEVFWYMDAVDAETYNALRELVKVKSDYFSITVRGTVGDVYTDIHAVVKRDGGGVRIVSYNEV